MKQGVICGYRVLFFSGYPSQVNNLILKLRHIGAGDRVLDRSCGFLSKYWHSSWLEAWGGSKMLIQAARQPGAGWNAWHDALFQPPPPSSHVSTTHVSAPLRLVWHAAWELMEWVPSPPPSATHIHTAELVSSSAPERIIFIEVEVGGVGVIWEKCLWSEIYLWFDHRFHSTILTRAKMTKTGKAKKKQDKYNFPVGYFCMGR